MSESDSMARLGTPACLAFPFRVGAAGPASCWLTLQSRQRLAETIDAEDAAGRTLATAITKKFSPE